VNGAGFTSKSVVKEPPLSKIANGALFSILLFVAAIALMAIGRHIRTRRVLRHPGIVDSGFGPVEGAVFALMGLLLAFTFAGAGDRFNSRRALLVEEVNAIDSVWARVDLLSPQAQQPLRDKLREYVDQRIELYRIEPCRASSRLARACFTDKSGYVPRASRFSLPAKRHLKRQ
jgi:hypothetical protein